MWKEGVCLELSAKPCWKHHCKPRAGRILVPCALGVPAASQHEILAERGRREGGKVGQKALGRDQWAAVLHGGSAQCAQQRRRVCENSWCKNAVKSTGFTDPCFRGNLGTLEETLYENVGIHKQTTLSRLLTILKAVRFGVLLLST